MAFTFSIRKEYEILLEITASEEVLSRETIMSHLIQKCFERVFQLIGDERKRQENEVVLGDESEEEDDSE